MRTKKIIEKYIFILSIIPLLSGTISLAQTIHIDGLVTASDTPVQNASVTFTDINDTTIKYSTITDMSGQYQIDVLLTAISAGDNKEELNFVLNQNYPNPFSSSTSISYKLKRPSNIFVTIFDVLGRQVREFSPGPQSLGSYAVVWDGKNNFGEKISPGIYFYRLKAGDKIQVRKMLYSPGANDFIISAANAHFSEQHTQNRAEITLSGETFTVNVTNTDNTLPTIEETQFENILVQNDTTINFSVEEYQIPNLATIYLDSTQQIIRGFGAANILPWRGDMTADEIEKAFGTDDGEIGFSILRLRVPTAEDDFPMNVPTAKAVYDMGAIIMASPWSPPASMKTNSSTVGGRLEEESYADYAAHLKSFADYMAENDVPIHSVSVQNEPDVNVTYESCDWNGAEMLKFMRENAADVGVPVCAPESFNFNKNMSNPILNDSLATANTAYISGHIYGGGLESYPLAVEKGKELWMTEHLELDITWPAAVATAKEIHDCMVAGMSAYIWWYIVRFYGPIHDGEDWPDDGIPDDTEKGAVTKRGFIMSHFARFIRPGYFRLEATVLPQSNIHLSAYKDGDKVVIVAINNSGQDKEQPFSLKDGELNSFIPYMTTSNENVVEQNTLDVVNGVFTATLPASSITTFVSD